MSDHAAEPQAPPIESAPAQARAAWDGIWTSGESEPEAAGGEEGPSVADKLEGLVHEFGDSLETERADVAYERALERYEEGLGAPGDVADELLGAVGVDERLGSFVEAWAEEDPEGAHSWLVAKEQEQAYGQAAAGEAASLQAVLRARSEHDATMDAYAEAGAAVAQAFPEEWAAHGPELGSILANSPDLLGAVRRDPRAGLEIAVRFAAEGKRAAEEAAWHDENLSKEWKRSLHRQLDGTANSPPQVNPADYFDMGRVLDPAETVEEYKQRLFNPAPARDASWARFQERASKAPNRFEERQAAGLRPRTGAFGKQVRAPAPHAGRAERPTAPTAPRPTTTADAEHKAMTEAYWKDHESRAGWIDWSRTR